MEISETDTRAALGPNTEKTTVKHEMVDTLAGVGAQAAGNRYVATPDRMNSGVGNNSNSLNQKDSAWKTVGGAAAPQRRSSQPAQSLFQRKSLASDLANLSTISENGKLSNNNNNASGATHNNNSRDASKQRKASAINKYDIFNTNERGGRSLSFSLGQQLEEFYSNTSVKPPPGLSSESIDENEIIDDDDSLGKLKAHLEHQRNSLLDPENRMALYHRRVSALSGQGKSFWLGANNRRPSDFFMDAQMYQNSALGGRRHTIAPGAVAPYDSKDLADRYFKNDPSLFERRQSLAAGMALHSPGSIETDEQLFNFANQYGNLLENSLTSPEPRSPMRMSRRNYHKGAVMTADGEQSGEQQMRTSRSHSFSEAVRRSSNFDSYSETSQNRLYVIEFKGGRTDLFYTPEESNYPLKRGDLVIVEADRGKDLGKITQINVPTSKLFEPATGKQLTPKRIYRYAKLDEVNLLLDKARDESKALEICKAKCKQKELPMEVVDAEYQWDRKKLTFFFLAEARIDFRELVRDLFKIYKTRIWMCAVERNRTNEHLVAFDDE